MTNSTGRSFKFSQENVWSEIICKKWIFWNVLFLKSHVLFLFLGFKIKKNMKLLQKIKMDVSICGMKNRSKYHKFFFYVILSWKINLLQEKMLKQSSY